MLRCTSNLCAVELSNGVVAVTECRAFRARQNLARTFLRSSLRDLKMLCILLDKTRNSLHVLSRSTSQRAPGTFASLKMTQEGMLSFVGRGRRLLRREPPRALMARDFFASLRNFDLLRVTRLACALPHGLSGITGRPEVAPYGFVHYRNVGRGSRGVREVAPDGIVRTRTVIR